MKGSVSPPCTRWPTGVPSLQPASAVWSTCVEDGVTGLLVDRSELRAAITRLLADEELRERLGAAGRAHAIDQHSWEAATAALLEVYSAAT